MTKRLLDVLKIPKVQKKYYGDGHKIATSANMVRNAVYLTLQDIKSRSAYSIEK